jgi:hypothetical protein
MEQGVKSIELDINSLLVRWYKWNVGSYNFKYNETDICKFRRVCFITGPLKVLFILAGSILLLGVSIVNWQSTIFIGGGVVLFFVTMFILQMFARLVNNKTAVSETVAVSWQSFKEKWCTKVEFTNTPGRYRED